MALVIFPQATSRRFDFSEATPESFSRYAQAAGYQLDYGQLTGDYEGYEAAQRSLDEAFAAARRRDSAGADTGPFLLQARLDYTLHRFAKTMEDLGAPEREATFFHDTPLLAEVKALRGASTFARGQYAEGLALLREAKALDDNASHAQRLALALAKVGAEDEAVRLFDDVEGSVATPRGRAWLSLQRGLLDLHRGRRASARQRLERARAFFPGFWLVDEHIAELDADEGRSDEATAGYRSLVARTGDPEFMDALARLVERNSPEEARALVARSSAIGRDRREEPRDPARRRGSDPTRAGLPPRGPLRGRARRDRQGHRDLLEQRRDLGDRRPRLRRLRGRRGVDRGQREGEGHRPLRLRVGRVARSRAEVTR